MCGILILRLINQRTSSMFRAVIFDLGGVIVDDPWPAMSQFYADYFEVTRADFLSACALSADKWQRGQIDEVTLWRKITAELGVQVAGKAGLWLAGLEHVYREKSEILQLIAHLKSEQYKVGLLSNTEPPVVDFIATRPLPAFDASVYSCSVGLLKPEKDIYQLVCKTINVMPSEAIFIDDKAENTAGAGAIGMTGLTFKTSHQVINDLNRLLQRS